MISKFINWILSFFRKSKPSEKADLTLVKKQDDLEAYIETLEKDIAEINNKDKSLDENIEYFNKK